MGNQRKRFSVAHLLFAGALSSLLFICACQSENNNKEEVPKKEINAVMEAHTEELMSIPGVVGVAIGETESHLPCIMVLIVEKKDEILDKIPKEFEGYPVCPFVSGEIKPMTGN